MTAIVPLAGLFTLNFGWRDVPDREIQRISGDLFSAPSSAYALTSHGSAPWNRS